VFPLAAPKAFRAYSIDAGDSGSGSGAAFCRERNISQRGNEAQTKRPTKLTTKIHLNRRKAKLNAKH